MNKILCFFGFHKWYAQQHGFMIDTGRCDAVIAWKQCEHCAKSKLIHILK